MGDTDDETLSNVSGFITPPLSPTKTISTEDWLSPRTPASPHKTRNCLIFPEIDDDASSPQFHFPSSPTKSKPASRFDVLLIPELSPSHGASLLPLDDYDSLQKQDDLQTDSRSLRSTLASIHSLSSVSTSIHRANSDNGELSHEVSIANSPPFSLGPRQRREKTRSISESRPNIIPGLKSRFSGATIIPPDGFLIVDEDSPPSPFDSDPPVDADAKSYSTDRAPLRHVSSPLRPSQWTLRGGLLSSPGRSRTSTPDRFIASRRPPAITRESFETNKPLQRQEEERSARRGIRSSADVFSQRLRRSDRLNDELRRLRESHLVMIGRTTANRRNTNFNNNSLPLGGRQVSAGAVWNVGGPSAVSDTVVGVSTGRGGIFGSGTNAPLYRSAFLNRADPDAELDAYERRLALALDIDQTERVLQHSPDSANAQDPIHDDTTSNPRHVWRDGAWIRDGYSPRLCSSCTATLQC